jgi:DNA-binding MarR family transcriptional regulator
MNITLKELITEILALPQVTQNEITVLLEIGLKDFTRDELLSGKREGVKKGTYSPAALTRTLQKLIKRGNMISTETNAAGEIVYGLIKPCESYMDYEKILLNITRSRLLTLNIMRVALVFILFDNKPSSARNVAKRLNMDPDYLVSVLQRMYLIGLLEKCRYEELDFKGDDIQYELEDFGRSRDEASSPRTNLLFFWIKKEWKGYIEESWL